MSAPAPLPPPPPPSAKSNLPLHYSDLPQELKWTSKNKSSPNPTHRGRHHKPLHSSKKMSSSSDLVAPLSPELPRKSYIRPWLEGELTKRLSSSSSKVSSLPGGIPGSNTPSPGPSPLHTINNSQTDLSYSNFMSFYDSTSQRQSPLASRDISKCDSFWSVPCPAPCPGVNITRLESTSTGNELVNSKAIMLQKFQKECSIRGMHIEIENEEQKHVEYVNKDEDKEKEMHVEIENTEEKKDKVGKEGKKPKLYFRRSKMKGKEVINEEIEMKILMEDKEVLVDEKDEPKMDASPGVFSEMVAKNWNLRPRKPYQRHQSANTNANESGSLNVEGGSIQKNKDKQPKKDSGNEQGSGDQKKGKQKKNKCKKNGKGKQENYKDIGQERNETPLSKLSKFSLQLTEEEIAEDLFAMTGARHSRRPKRRSKAAQREIDQLTPGMYLDSITSDSYNVNEHIGKGMKE